MRMGIGWGVRSKSGLVPSQQRPLGLGPKGRAAQGFIILRGPSPTL